MCELFAMSSRQPSALTYSLNEFSKHGGLTHGNNSGWGIAYFEERDAFLVKEPEPASDSPWVKFIAEQELESQCVIAHVRLATIGKPMLRNTHPFRRALAGRAHVFAHNGTLKGLHDTEQAQNAHYQPIGETDSELAFCLLLERLRSVWLNNDQAPSVNERLRLFAGFASDMRRLGSANFLYSDGEVLFAHADRRIYEEGGGFSEPRAPGLSLRNCVACQQGPEWACDGLRVGLGDQSTLLLASVPLDEYGWEALPEGTALAVRDGMEIARLST
ncbi:class II glutamine amidotransferase [Pelagibius sp. Alg239-R121]|uniref:class II glutamine amidotransferase n=1 Tax=Pelagibius sp. Alg239-R121 TaxID=2993448 RepID=UPI0024A756D6|nr:class II glutamine amidotransferase [Pelagibius sp. Alg239-R121]